MPRILVLLMAVFLAGQAAAGTWTGNQFVYKPSLGARGEAEKNTFDAGLDRVDAHLGKYKTLGDPGYSTLSEALTTIGSAEITLIVPAGVINISVNTTIPANVHLLVLRGGQFSIADGVTLTINGPFEAGPYRVFAWTGSGKVVFGDGALDWALPEWWGAKGDNSTDCSAALQAAFNAWWRVRLGKGTYLWTSTSPLYLNSTSGGQYFLQGQGVEVTYLKFPNIGASAYCIKVNEDAAGSKVRNFPTLWRLHLMDMRIYGNTTNYPNLLKIRETSVRLENLILADFTDGVVTADYCDNMVVRNVKWADGPPAGFLLRQGGNGDGWVVEGVFVDNYMPGYVGHQRGVFIGSYVTCHVFRNIVGGRFEFGQSHDILIENWHCENNGDLSVFTSTGGTITVRRSFIWNNRNAVPVVINDGSYKNTRLVLEDVTFHSYFSALIARTSDIHIQNINGQGLLELRNVISMPYYNWPSEPLGIVITSDNTGLNTELAKIKHKRLFTNCRLYLRDGTWRIEPLEGLPRYHTLSNPGFIWIGGVSLYISNLSAGTYYYKVAYYYDDGIHTAASAEGNATVTAGQCVGMRPSFKPYTVLRIWRGTQSGVYDRYVDIPMAKAGEGYVYDQGDFVNGFVWITTNVPTPPTANTTMEGIEHPNGKREFWASAAPTSAEFTGVQGDRVWNTAPAAGGTPGWVCVTAGSPGTWKAMANLAN